MHQMMRVVIAQKDEPTMDLVDVSVSWNHVKLKAARNATILSTDNYSIRKVNGKA